MTSCRAALITAKGTKGNLRGAPEEGRGVALSAAGQINSEVQGLQCARLINSGFLPGSGEGGKSDSIHIFSFNRDICINPQIICFLLSE